MQDSPTPGQLLAEAIAFWTVGLILFLGRLWSRAIFKKSWKNLQPDDYVMIATFCVYTALLVMLQISCRYATNEMLPSELPAVLADPHEVARRIYGSKIAVGSNQCYLLTLWGVKACLLMLYFRMTQNMSLHLFVKCVIVYVIIGFLAIEIPYFFILCRPFSQYWALPVHNPQCASYFYYCIIQTVFNVSSDAIMLLIPVPFIVKARVPPLKKALLAAIFSLGIFVILAAVLHKYYNFTMPNTTIYMLWDIRETSTSIYVANIMCWWPLLRKIFGWRAFLMSGSSGKNENRANVAAGRIDSKEFAVSTKVLDRSTPSTSPGGNVHRDVSGFSCDDLDLERSESQETLNKAHRLGQIEEEPDEIELRRLSDSVVGQGRACRSYRP